MTVGLVTALAAILWTLPAYGQSATGSIQGQIADRKSKGPLRFAKLQLLGPYPQARLVAPTRVAMLNPVSLTADEQGRFTFSNLAAGNYIINVQRDGYIPERYGATGTQRQLIPVKPGEPATVSITMSPCGVIAGKVVNERGEPVQNVELVVLRYYYGAWMWRLSATPETPLKSYTNDLGEYRIPNMITGTYIIRAAVPPAGGRNRTIPVSYPSTFYPNALSPEKAEPVVIASGETTRADFSLQPGPAYRLAGVIDSHGSTEEVCFGLAPKNYHSALAQVIGRVTRFARDGIFALDGVPPGSYVLSAAICRGVESLGAIVPLEVTGNIEGMNIQLASGRKLSGTVKAEGVDVAGIRLTLRSPELLPGFTPSANVAADGTFTFEHVLPRHHIVDFSGLPAGAYVTSVKYAEREVPPRGFEIDGDDAIEITLSNQGGGQLSGVILDKTGRPAPFAAVTLLPADGGPAQSAKDVTADENGNFVFPALRPGTYKALAWQVRYNPFGIEVADPMLALLFDSNARTVSIAPGAAATVGLKLNTQDDVDRARVVTRMTPPKSQ